VGYWQQVTDDKSKLKKARKYVDEGAAFKIISLLLEERSVCRIEPGEGIGITGQERGNPLRG